VACSKKARKLLSGLSARQERIAVVLRAEVCLRWQEGRVPGIEGGRFFRELAGRLDVPEYAIADVARFLGFWTLTPAQLEEELNRLRDYGEAPGRHRITPRDRAEGYRSAMDRFHAPD
jgi:hypothetical protein